MKAPLPENEAHRLAILRDYNVLDSLPEQIFDDLTLLAAQICQTPIALITLVDEDRQWFKSKIGLSATETSRDVAFCAHAILNVGEVMEVRDAQLDPRFADNPLVTADPHIRFYAGAPLVTPDGLALGALCAMDRVPRELSHEQKAALSALSRTVVAQLELRRAAQRREMEQQSHTSGKTDNKKWKLENTAIATFMVAILALLVVGAISIRSLFELGKQVEWVQHTYQVLEQAESMLKNMIDVQSGQRGYLITGKAEFLETYNAARTDVLQDVQELRRLTKDNPSQQQRLDELAPLVTERLAIAHELILLRQSQGFKAAQKSVALGRDQAVLDQIRLLQRKMVAEEQRLLAERSQRQSKSIQFTLVSIGSLGALAIIVLGLAGARVRREIIERSAAQSRGEMLNADLESRAVELAAARHRAETSDQFKSAILEQAGHAIISTMPDGIITTFNQTAERMLGYSAREMVSLQTPAIFHDPAEIEARAQEFSTELSETIAPSFEVFVAKARRNLPNEYEWTYIRKDGTRLPVLLAVTALRDAAGAITGFLDMAVDITERKRIEAELHQALEELRQREESILKLALHDELTGLPNRRLFYDRLETALSEARRYKLKVAVAFIDLDFFKEINDKLGHEVGDKFLVAIAEKIKSVPREMDTCARLGGDEFALVLANVQGQDQTALVAQRILGSLEGQLNIGGIQLQASASIGIAIFPDDADDAATLLKLADSAMYRSKEEGRNTYRFWDETMTAAPLANQIREFFDRT